MAEAAVRGGIDAASLMKVVHETMRVGMAGLGAELTEVVSLEFAKTRALVLREVNTPPVKAIILMA